MNQITCFQCGHTANLTMPVGRRDECVKCHADLHVCKDCQFYDRNAYNECREPSADPVQDKERANFCDYFQPSGGASSAQDRTKDLMAAAEALFKKKT
jgi:hypothetical protein